METHKAYQAPKEALVSESDNEVAEEIRIFTFQGRIGRLRFLAYGLAFNLVATLCSALISAFTAASGSMELMLAATLVTLIISIAFNLMVWIRRFHDLDISGWACVAGFIPLINLLVGLYLLFAPGTQGKNRYGLEPPQNGIGVILSAFVVPVLIIALLAAIAIPAYVDYSERARAVDQQYPQEQTDNW